MSLTFRSTHRDLAYLYVGILISFAFSGIFFNHRKTWDPKQYTYSEQAFMISALRKDQVDDDFIKSFSTTHHIEDVLRRYSVKDNTLKISYERHEVVADITTGKGTIEEYRTTPLLGHMAKLHKSESVWWIYYSDGFGIAIVLISISGLFLVKGKNSFRQRGWKLALAGILFPLIFIIFLME